MLMHFIRWSGEEKNGECRALVALMHLSQRLLANLQINEEARKGFPSGFKRIMTLH